MKCLMCKNGVTAKGKATVTLTRGGSVVVIKEVPAQVCRNCGEYYLDEGTAETVYRQADDAVKRGAEVEVFRYRFDPSIKNILRPSVVAEKKPSYRKTR